MMPNSVYNFVLVECKQDFSINEEETMMSNFTDSFLSANTGSFPSEQLPSLRQRLSQLDESQANQVIATANIKNPTTALILSIFLGTLGVDRFYIGHVGLGVAKLLLAWLTFGIWTIIDWFLIINATKKANLAALNNALATMTVSSANEG